MTKDSRVERAIEAFVETHEMEEKLQAAVAAVASRNPAAVLIFWEEDEGYGALTVPHSKALALGLADAAYDMLVNKKGQEEEDDDDSDFDESEDD